jgi:arylsulfatase
VAEKKPNILVIWGDDIGMWNLSCYSRGSMGYRTPNIDRIANEGAIFTDHYAQPSCTTGRAAFITGQLPIRTGMTTVGLPAAKFGLQKEDPTLAEPLHGHHADDPRVLRDRDARVDRRSNTIAASGRVDAVQFR